MTMVSRLYVLLCGFEIIPKTISTRDRGGRFIMSEPISAYLLETDYGYVLVDTGVNSTLIHDPKLRREYFIAHGWDPAPVVLPEHEILAQFQSIGVRTEDVSQVILTHMHADHTGNLRLFLHTEVYVQRVEYEHAFSGDTSPAWFLSDYSFPDLDWHLVEGDYEVMPGLRIISTPGHTPGHQSVLVDLPKTGTLLLVGDAGDLKENFAEEIPPGETVDDCMALESIRRLKRLVRRESGRLFLGHDPNFIQAIRLAPSYYE